MNKIIGIGIGIALLGLATTHSSYATSAPAAEVKYLTYTEAVEIALRDNWDLLALRNQEESFKLRSKQALAPNNPVFSLSRNDTPGFSLTQAAAQTSYALNWTLGFPGKSLTQSASTRHLGEATREQAISKEIDIITALSNNFISFSINQNFYQFLLEDQKRSKELMKLLEKKYSASQAAKVDLLNLEVVIQTTAQSILQNRNDYEILVTQFRQIIRRPEDKTLLPQIPTEIAIPKFSQSFEELVPLLLRNRHLLQASQKQVESAQALLNNARLQPFPDLQLMGGINNWLPSGAPLSGILRDYSMSIGIAIPLFLPFNEIQGMKAASHDLLAAENQLESQRLQAVSDLQTTFTSLNAAQKELDGMVRLVVPAAKASYDLTLMTYSLGKADYFVLNQSRQSWVSSEKDLLTKRQSVAQLYNQLIAQVGCDITKTEGPHACQ